MAVEERLAKVDPNLRLTVVTDQARYIRSSVREVLETASIGGLLAVLVLYLFLRSFRATGIIAVAIPLSVVATFFLMYLGGVSLNIMSLGGIAIAIGTMVDMGVVVVENILKHLERQGEDASLTGVIRAATGEVGGAVMTAVATTVISFLPIFTMGKTMAG